MNRWMKLGTLAIGIALVGLLAVNAPAYAQGGGPGRGGRWGGREQSLVAVAAEVLGLERTALVAELNAGQTLAEVAEAKGVDPATIVDAFLAPRAEALAEAVAEGRLTQAQADAQLATMEANVTARLSAPISPRGTGAGFVDANGDGVCDNGGTRQPRGPRGGNR